MYYFVEPLTSSLDDKLHEKFTRHTSDLSKNPEGYILTEEQIRSLSMLKYRGGHYWNIYDIPEEYQNDIDSFISAFWDGDVILE